MRSRDGFTLLELLIVLIIVGIAAGVAIPQVGRMLAQTRVQRAASVVAADLKLAHSLAGRQRQPVRIVVDAAAQVLRVRNDATTAVYSERYFHSGGEYPVDSFATTDASVVVYPNGLSDGQLIITLGAAGRSRQILMTRAGQVRVSEP